MHQSSPLYLCSVQGIADRSTYDGPLAMSTDLTVYNGTPDYIEVREVKLRGQSQVPESRAALVF